MQTLDAEPPKRGGCEELNTTDEGANVADQPNETQGGAKSEAGDDFTRKQFLTTATLGVGGLMGALVALPAAGMALAPVFGKEDFQPVLLGKLDEFREGEFTKVVLRPHSDEPGAYIRKQVAFVRLNKDAKVDKIALKGQEEYTVVSNICMHLGCPVQASNSGFVCPCHGGSYDADGKRQAGPPVRPLDRYLWEKRGDELWAIARYAITNDGKRVSNRDPGQASDGINSLLYPLQPSS